MKKHIPITVAESRFLDHDQDLISVTPRSLPSSGTGIADSPFPAVVIASTVILLPLLAFSLISEFSGRLLVVTIVACAVSVFASNLSTGVERLIDAKDGWKCAGGYVSCSRFLQYIDVIADNEQIFRVHDGGCYIYSLSVQSSNVCVSSCLSQRLFVTLS